MSKENTILALKHHILNGRLETARKLATVANLNMEDCADEDGNTALHWCAQALVQECDNREATDTEMFTYLYHAGAPRNRQNNLGETPLFTAVRCAVAEEQRATLLVQEMLVKAKVDPSRTDMTGETPLMEAAASGMEGIGKLLLEHRANPIAASTSGLTAMQLAEENGNQQFVALLKSPLAERAAKEARQLEAEGKNQEEQREAEEKRKEKEMRRAEQTFQGQKLKPGIAKDKDAPGKPYPEYGTLHDID
eukprot:gnl/TRDRNA2_/TRDRNA2_179194_c0_seq1.p2 gnl/TRDRNA2_/TRDRNA2_179194_c0~~gnl/TRDRNA2_/TRDRNA2_179194_c0_seq1.p2  ORF type:complete len:251 (+),score=71.67 gnl/TRDRNA2_/TRDRNA2_179194_c0_seq1:122-874(+)